MRRWSEAFCCRVSWLPHLGHGMQHHLVTRQSSWLPTNALQTEAMCLLACLWITALRLHSAFLLFLSVIYFLSLTTHTQTVYSAHLLSTLQPNSFFYLSLFLDFLWVLSGFFFLNNSLFLSLLLLALTETLQLGWLVRSMIDTTLPATHEWKEANADRSFIITPKKTTLSLLTIQPTDCSQNKTPNHSFITPQNSHSELCQQKSGVIFCQKRMFLHIIL